MGIRRITSKSDIQREIEEQVARWQQVIVNNLIYVGEAALKHAREVHKYTDRTGNLTSSIGYCVLVDGKSVFESTFEVLKKGQQGAVEGRKFLSQLTRKHSKGVVLIMVAGMEYAEYVEAKGLDVLESAEMQSRRLIPVLMNSLKL